MVIDPYDLTGHLTGLVRSRSKIPRRTSGGWRVVEAFSIRSFRFQWTADAGSTWAAEMETLISRLVPARGDQLSVIGRLTWRAPFWRNSRFTNLRGVGRQGRPAGHADRYSDNFLCDRRDHHDPGAGPGTRTAGIFSCWQRLWALQGRRNTLYANH